MRDSIIFEYIGWYLTQGGRLYIDVWELKPPLSYEVSALLVLLTGGDPVLGHWLAVLVTSAGAIGTALVVGAVVKDLTGSDLGALAAGIALYAFPAYHWRAALGFKPKYFVPLFALLGVYLAHRGRDRSAGVAAGIAIGFWQVAAIAPVLAAGIAAQRDGRRAATRVIIGTGAVLVAIVLPVVYWGAIEAMVTEVVLVPLLVSERGSALVGIQVAAIMAGGALPLALLGIIGVAAAVRWRPRTTWWLAVGTVWFVLQVLVLDLDGPPDLIPLLAFLAVGLGVMLGIEPGSQRPAALLVALLAVISVVTMGGFVATPDLYDTEPVRLDPAMELTPPYSIEEQEGLYWNRVPPETCRVFYGPTQHELVELTDQAAVQDICGEAAPVVEALVNRWAGG